MSTIAVTADDVWNWLCNMRPGGKLSHAIPLTLLGDKFWDDYISEFLNQFIGQDPSVECKFLHLSFIYEAFNSGDLP